MTDRQKETLKWALNQALITAQDAVVVYTEDGEHNRAEEFEQDAADLRSLIKELT